MKKLADEPRSLQILKKLRKLYIIVRIQYVIYYKICINYVIGNWSTVDY